METESSVSSCEPKGFLPPCLLLLLRERPGHGYDLVERLKPFGVADGDPGGVYRALRAMERDGLARSDWGPSEAGPARRTYRITLDGLAMLDHKARELAETRGALDIYLLRYALLSSGSAPANGAGRNGGERHGS